MPSSAARCAEAPFAYERSATASPISTILASKPRWADSVRTQSKIALSLFIATSPLKVNRHYAAQSGYRTAKSIKEICPDMWKKSATTTERDRPKKTPEGVAIACHLTLRAALSHRQAFHAENRTLSHLGVAAHRQFSLPAHASGH